MTLGQYVRLWWDEARTAPLSNARIAGFLVTVVGGIAVAIFAPGVPSAETALRAASWLVPLVVFVVFLLPELVRAPYRLHLKVVGARDKAIAERNEAVSRIDKARDEARAESLAQIEALQIDNEYLAAPSKPILVPVETATIEENPIVRNERNTAVPCVRVRGRKPRSRTGA